MPDNIPIERSYRLVARGELDDRFASGFVGVRVARLAGATVLTGNVVDQSLLHGLLGPIQELGINLQGAVENPGHAAERAEAKAGMAGWRDGAAAAVRRITLPDSAVPDLHDGFGLLCRGLTGGD